MTSARPESPHRRHGPHPTPRESATLAPPRPRYPEFDALRGAAILLVVTLHAALAYTHLDIPRLLWGVRDPSTHLGFDLFSWWAMGVSVPLFFTISGFFASEIYESRGPVGFLKNRSKRIVAPFLLSVATLLPLCFFAWSYGWIVTGRCTFREIRRMRFADPAIEPDLYGPAHLWFLEYLIFMLAAFVTIRLIGRRRSIAHGSSFDAWFLASWSPFALAIPTAFLMLISRECHGIDVTFDRHNSFFPDPLRLLHYGSFFVFGVGVHQARAMLGTLAARGPWYLLALIPVFTARAWLFRRDLDHRLDGAAAIALAGLGGLFAWLTVFGVLGLFRKLFHRPSRVVRYLAESSYWIYLIHLPIIGLLQADLYRLNWPTEIKFAVTWIMTFAMGIASYHVLVRRRPKCQTARDDSRGGESLTFQCNSETTVNSIEN